nr:hypothetical protein CFP56_40563 [Quercus suber]
MKYYLHKEGDSKFEDGSGAKLRCGVSETIYFFQCSFIGPCFVGPDSLFEKRGHPGSDTFFLLSISVQAELLEHVSLSILNDNLYTCWKWQLAL